MDFEKELGAKISSVYSRSFFGKVSKVELDIIVFGCLVKESLKDTQESK